MLNQVVGLLSAAAPTIDLTGVDFGIITTTITELIPKVMPAVIGLLAVRKGISFFRGMLKGA